MPASMTIPNLLTAADEPGAVEVLHELGCTDGLPVVVPTPERVDRMILATGLDADLVVGEMGPQGGAAAVHKIAVNAVMAGCLPDYAPVVIAAIRAMCEPEFDLGEMQGTTHCTAPLVIVNGPARDACGGIASGFGALGPGTPGERLHRAGDPPHDDQHRRRAARALRHGPARASGEVHVLPGRGGGGFALSAFPHLSRVPVRRRAW